MKSKSKSLTPNTACDACISKTQPALTAEQLSAVREHMKEIKLRMAAIEALIEPKQMKGRVISFSDLKNNWG